MCSVVLFTVTSCCDEKCCVLADNVLTTLWDPIYCSFSLAAWSVDILWQIKFVPAEMTAIAAGQGTCVWLHFHAKLD